MFSKAALGTLVPISGTDPVSGPWEHKALVPDPLPETMPELSPETFLRVADARAALAALDNTARQLPNPQLLRMPTLRREAQSTSALEGTYAPLDTVLVADEDEPATVEMMEILNYVRMANHGFASVAEGRPLTVGGICELQGLLMRGMQLEPVSGRLRDQQVVIGQRPGVSLAANAVQKARFIPPPHGIELEAGVQELLAWMGEDRLSSIDPVVAAAMSHYQFETLHPFRDGNGRTGRFLIVVHFLLQGVLEEPTLTVSPWFEARRGEYYEMLLGVSTQGRWDNYIRFFAEGIKQSADLTRNQMVGLVSAQEELKNTVRGSSLRANTALQLVDLAVANPSFTVRRVSEELKVSYTRANNLVGQLVDLGVLDVVDADAYKRRFYAPAVIRVLTMGS